MKFADCKERLFCELCGQPAERHEIVTRGSGGPREPWNQLTLCRDHHDAFHRIGRTSFAAAYPQFAERIESACERMGRVMR